MLLAPISSSRVKSSLLKATQGYSRHGRTRQVKESVCDFTTKRLHQHLLVSEPTMPRPCASSIQRLPDRVDQRTGYASCGSLSSLRASTQSASTPLSTMPLSSCSNCQTNLCSMSMSALETQILAERCRRRIPEELLSNDDLIHAVQNTMPLEDRARRAQRQQMRASKAVETVPVAERDAAKLVLQVAELELRSLDVEYARLEAEDSVLFCANTSFLDCSCRYRPCTSRACLGTRRSGKFEFDETQSCCLSASTPRCVNTQAERERLHLFYAKKKLVALAADVTYTLNNHVRVAGTLRKTHGLLLRMRQPLLASIASYRRVTKIAHQRITDIAKLDQVKPSVVDSRIAGDSSGILTSGVRYVSVPREKQCGNRTSSFNSALALAPPNGVVRASDDFSENVGGGTNIRGVCPDLLDKQEKNSGACCTSVAARRNPTADEADSWRLLHQNDCRFSIEDGDHHPTSASECSAISSVEHVAPKNSSFWSYPDYTPVSTSTLSSGRSTPTITFSFLERSYADTCYEDSDEASSTLTDTPSPTAAPASPHDIIRSPSDTHLRFYGTSQCDHDPYIGISDFSASKCNGDSVDRYESYSGNDLGTPPASPLSSDSFPTLGHDANPGSSVKIGACNDGPGSQQANSAAISVARHAYASSNPQQQDISGVQNSSIPLTQRLRFTMSAPRRTLARLQIARVRIPNGVKAMWTDANNQFIAAVAQKPSLTRNQIYRLHLQTNLREANATYAGILGPWLVRAPKEAAVDLLQRVLDLVNRALPVLEELVAQEECHIRTFEKDKAAVSRLIDGYDGRILALQYRPARALAAMSDCEPLRDHCRDGALHNSGRRRNTRKATAGQSRALSDLGVKTFRALSSNIESSSFNPTRSRD